jgi:hypothetical protein
MDMLSRTLRGYLGPIVYWKTVEYHAVYRQESLYRLINGRKTCISSVILTINRE